MICIAPQRTRGYEAAVEQFCSLIIEQVAQAEPGDVLHNVTGSELVAAMEGVLAMLPHLHGTFAIDQWLRV